MKKLIFLLTIAKLSLFAHFTYDLAETVEKEDANWAISPYSIATTLSMLQSGAEGLTKFEISDVLKNFTPDCASHKPAFPSDFELNIANGIWVKKGFELLPSFTQDLETTFQAKIEQVEFSFSTADTINHWVANETHNQIQKLVSPAQFTPNTRMVLVDALYFKGAWLRPFSKKATKSDSFFAPSKESLVDFMSQTATFSYFQNDDWSAITLPFKKSEGSFSPACILLLPEKDGTLPSASLIEEVLSQSVSSSIIVSIPKFQIEKEWDLKNCLQSMGIESAFTPAADFSSMNGARDLFVSDFIHKVFFSFNEGGVTAAAATSASMICTSSALKPNAPPKQFIANRPFYFLLLDLKSNQVFFIGHVINPEHSKN